MLLKLAGDYGKPVPVGIMIGVRLTHQDISELINVSRPTVTELLNQCESAKTITTLRRRLILLDHEGLKRLAAQGSARTKENAK